MSVEIYFHIGLPKTASTYLQTGVFGVHPQVELIEGGTAPWSVDLLEALIRPTAADHDGQRASELIAVARERARQRGSNVLVVSCERFSGDLASGGYDRAAIAGRIKAAAPDARIICVVRAQRELLLSGYKQMVREGYTGSMERLLTERNWRFPTFDEAYFDFWNLRTTYTDRFDDDRVMMLDYRLLKADLARFEREVFGFMSVDARPPTCQATVHPSLSGTSTRMLRRLNHVRRSDHQPHPMLALPEPINWRVRQLLAKWSLRSVDSSLAARDMALLDGFQDRFAASNALVAPFVVGDVNEW